MARIETHRREEAPEGNPVIYSSLQAFDELVASGLPEEQARAVVATQERGRSELATKADISLLRKDMEKMFWRGIAIVGTAILAATGIIIGAIAAF